MITPWTIFYIFLIIWWFEVDYLILASPLNIDIGLAFDLGDIATLIVGASTLFLNRFGHRLIATYFILNAALWLTINNNYEVFAETLTNDSFMIVKFICLILTSCTLTYLTYKLYNKKNINKMK